MIFVSSDSEKSSRAAATRPAVNRLNYCKIGSRNVSGQFPVSANECGSGPNRKSKSLHGVRAMERSDPKSTGRALNATATAPHVQADHTQAAGSKERPGCRFRDDGDAKGRRGIDVKTVAARVVNRTRPRIGSRTSGRERIGAGRGVSRDGQCQVSNNRPLSGVACAFAPPEVSTQPRLSAF